MTERLTKICAIYAVYFCLLLGSKSQAAEGLNRDECTWNGIPLFGRVQVVESFADIKVEIVTSFPDLRVKTVESFPDKCGRWEFVESFPDFKIQYVNSFPDVKVEFVESFPGWP